MSLHLTPFNSKYTIWPLYKSFRTYLGKITLNACEIHPDRQRSHMFTSKSNVSMIYHAYFAAQAIQRESFKRSLQSAHYIQN
jgi:hypothetical protein